MAVKELRHDFGKVVPALKTEEQTRNRKRNKYPLPKSIAAMAE
jgi:hypothetical protein